MKLIDRQYLLTPFFGSRKMAAWLKGQGYHINRKHVRRLMRVMGLRAIYRRPRTSKPAPGHKIYPYLLGGMKVTRPGQVWAADITYIRIRTGFVYLAAILDAYSRKVIGYAVSVALDTTLTIQALNMAIAGRHQALVSSTTRTRECSMPREST